MRKFNTRKILLIVGAVLFTVLFVFSGFMALRQYRDTKQSAEAFNAVADLVKPVPTTLPEDEGNEEDSQPSAEPAPTLTSYDRFYRLAHHRGDKHQLSRHADAEQPGLLSEAQLR